MIYTGIVENRSDPLQLGRCQVRIVGLHTHDKTQLTTNQLPWATPIQSISSAAMNGIGYTPLGPVEGTTVIIVFADHDKQQPLIVGTVGGIPQTPVAISADDNDVAVNASTKVSDISLTTIVGPVTGKQLTFTDSKGSTNLTSGLTANMFVVGYGLSSTCFIVSVDSGTQITISESVTGYGQNIITFKAAPTNLNAVAQSKASNVVTDGSGNPVVSGNGQPVTTSTPVEQSAVNKSIPTVPPPKSVSNTAKATAGINALIAACDKVGLTTKEQKCSLLGIAGGESGWIPQLESYNYSKSRIKQIFSFLSDADVEQYSDAQKKGLTREQFFSVIYGPTRRGKGFLGNLTDADGGKYFGRGFIQLTGRGNYKRYNDLANKMGLNIDILNNPDSLDADLDVSAIVAALYIKDRVPSAVSTTDNPGFFYAAKKAVGVNSPDIAARKLSYYQYFYGAEATGSVEKSAGTPAPTPPPDGASVTPGPSADSIARGTDNTGFRDPNNKYPLQDYINEPDTNRLARGIIKGTVVELKDGTRDQGIPIAIDGGTWDQPLSAFGAKYPFNKVLETESGHIQEFDDTPGQERIHTYHRAGTYHEIDPNGSETVFINGESYVIMLRNNFVHIQGDCNLTVAGNVNIYAQSDANIQVEGDATLQVGNNLTAGVANDFSLAVGGNMQIKAGGSFDIAADNMTVNSANNLFMQSGAGTSINADSIEIESAGDTNILAGGTLYADYSQGQFGNGASSAQTVDSFDLPPPAAGNPLYPDVPELQAPDRVTEELAAAETPDDYATAEGRAFANSQAQENGVPNPAAPAVDASAQSTPTGGSNTNVPVDCKVIYGTTNFTDDYRLSPNFTLGMLISGGLAGPHKLVDQVLKDSPAAQERVYTVQEIVCNLAQLAQNVLEPALGVLPGGIGGYGKQWKVTSGYRLKGVIKQESPTSDHCKGMAADIALMLPDRYNATYNMIQKIESIVPYDQLILEYRYKDQVWMHMSYKSKGSRKMAFTMANDKTFQRNGFALLTDGASPPQKA
jgi:predicted chitinase